MLARAGPVFQVIEGSSWAPTGPLLRARARVCCSRRMLHRQPPSSRRSDDRRTGSCISRTRAPSARKTWSSTTPFPRSPHRLPASRVARDAARRGPVVSGQPGDLRGQGGRRDPHVRAGEYRAPRAHLFPLLSGAAPRAESSRASPPPRQPPLFLCPATMARHNDMSRRWDMLDAASTKRRCLRSSQRPSAAKLGAPTCSPPSRSR